MQRETLDRLIALLRAMPSQMVWTRYTTEMYTAVLCRWPDEFAERVLRQAFESEEWRPAPARLLSIGVEVAAPVPDADLCYAEIMHKASAVGLYGRPDPERPSVRLPGPPPMSHPLVARIVSLCGGWQMICTGEAGMQEGMRKQVRSAHETAVGEWRQRVLSAWESGKPAPALFRNYPPYELPAGYVTDVTDGAGIRALGTGERLLPEPARPALVAMPDSIREKLAALGFSGIGRNLREREEISR